MNYPNKAQQGFFYSSPHIGQEQIYPLIMELYRWADPTSSTSSDKPHFNHAINLEALSNCNPKDEDETFREALIRCADLMTKYKTYWERHAERKGDL